MYLKIYYTSQIINRQHFPNISINYIAVRIILPIVSTWEANLLVNSVKIIHPTFFLQIIIGHLNTCRVFIE